MAEKKPEEDNKSLKITPSGSLNRSNRLEAQNRQRDQNNALFAQLYASLEGEHRKLRELQQRRSKLIEEMKSLRALLFAENKRLRQTVAPITGVPIPVPSGNPVAKNPAETSPGPSTSLKSPRLERRSSTKSVTIAEPPERSLTITERPRASSSQSLQKKVNRRSLKPSLNKTKRRKPLDNISNTREDLLDELGESALSISVGSNLQTLVQERSNFEEREDRDEVAVPLPELFTLMDSQFADTSPAILPTSPDTNDSKASEEPLGLLNPDQDPSFYLPSARSIFGDLIGTDSAPLIMDLPGVSLELPPFGIAECSANAGEVVENEPEKESDSASHKF
ncbi:uncharacterized protein LOC108024498 [Drosophila biarmipes]|uniref:uncharacterized protein LOC108024498 n=1 Tax=Drosophila biarmipes TaxID=125945 RepID=UPI0007E8AA24|nr:uncharacterized protein LOC108024498 [Drosophila biarmipes]